MKIKNLKNLSSGFSTIKRFITANSPVLLTGAAVTGVVTTGVLAAKSGYTAGQRVMEAEHPSTDFSTPESPLTTSEKAQLTWKLYLAPGVTGVTTLASVVGVHTIHTKRHAALAGLYAMASTKLDDYQEKAEELLGARKTQALNNELAARSVERLDPINDEDITYLPGGTELLIDQFTGRPFMSNIAEVEKACLRVNLLLEQNNGHASLNDFYEAWGVSDVPAGELVGWNRGAEVSPRFGSALVNGERSVVTVGFHPDPKPGYRN